MVKTEKNRSRVLLAGFVLVLAVVLAGCVLEEVGNYKSTNVNGQHVISLLADHKFELFVDGAVEVDIWKGTYTKSGTALT